MGMRVSAIWKDLHLHAYALVNEGDSVADRDGSSFVEDNEDILSNQIYLARWL